MLDEQPAEAIIKPSEADDLELEPTNPIGEIEQLEPDEAIDLSLEESALQPSEIGIQAAQETNSTNSESSSTTIQNSGNPMSVTSNNLATVGASSANSDNVVPSGNCGCDGGAVAS